MEENNLNQQEVQNSPQVVDPATAEVTPKKRISMRLAIILFLIVALLTAIVLGLILNNNDSSSQASNTNEASQEQLAKFRQLEINEDDVKFYANNFYSGAMAHSPGFVWVANGHGLIRFNTETTATKLYTQADGLLSTNTKHIAYFEGSVWVASSENGVNHPAGISRLKLDDETWQTFRSEDYNFGRLIEGKFTVDNNRLSFIDVSRDLGTTTATYNFDSQEWQVTTDPNGSLEIPFTEDDWETTLTALDSNLSFLANVAYSNRCDDKQMIGVRKDQYFNTPLYGGVVSDDQGKIWRGCMKGFVVIDQPTNNIDFIDASNGKPSVIYDVLTAKEDRLVVHSNLGLGVYSPESTDWELIRPAIRSIINQEYDAWNSAVWIDDKIYFVEVLINDNSGLVGGIRDVKLWRYNISNQSLDDVTPQPQSTIQAAHYRIPPTILPTNDGQSLMFESQQIIYRYTPSVPEPKVTVLDFTAPSFAQDPENYWGFAETSGDYWYLTDTFLGRISSDGGVDKFPLADGFDGTQASCLDASANFVTVHGGPFRDKQLYIFDINSTSWSPDALGQTNIVSLACGEDQILVEEGRFEDYFISDSSSERPEAIEANPNVDLGGIQPEPAKLLAIPLNDYLNPIDLSKFLSFANLEFSQLVEDSGSVWIRHGLTGLTQIKNRVD